MLTLIVDLRKPRLTSRETLIGGMANPEAEEASATTGNRGLRATLSGMLKLRPATTISCATCGSVYVRRAERVNFRGKDEKNCEVCGELLESWDGRRTPTFKLVKRGELPKR